MDRISRQEMKRDELAATLYEIGAAAGQHARTIGVVAVSLLVLGAAAGGGVWYSRGREAASRQKLGSVLSAAAVRTSEELPPEAAASRFESRPVKYREVLRLAEVVLAEHPSSAASRWAVYYKALSQKELGDLDGAARTLQVLTASGEEDFASGAARVLEAQVQEARGDLAGAASTYATLAAAPPGGFPVDLALANEARLLDAQGKSVEALEVYRRLSEEHPESPYAGEASRRVREARG